MAIAAGQPPPSPGKALHLSPPSPASLLPLISGCRNIGQLLQFHAAAIRHEFDGHPRINFELQRSYASLGRVDCSVSLFSNTPDADVFFYTSIIHAHAVNNLPAEGLFFYVQMLTRSLEPSEFTLSAVLKACTMEQGKGIHCQALKLGCSCNLYVRTALVDVYSRGGDLNAARQLFDTMPERSLVSATSMIAGYAKHGELHNARLLFDEMRDKDVVCWNVMIDGYTQHGRPSEALLLFRKMLCSVICPNEMTLVAALSACGQLGALESGKWIHSYMESKGIQMNVHVGTALVDMYSKCGSSDKAEMVFNKIKDKDIVSWNSMIVGYALNGFCSKALLLFNEMHKVKYLQPTDVTFIGILTACANAGLVSEGWDFFYSMKNDHKIEPKVEHYGCMVNLLGRAGHLEEAYELVKGMKIDPDPVIWATLLNACGLHGNINLGEKIARFHIVNNSANSGTYVLLSNIYAAKGNWDGVSKMRAMMKEEGVPKEPGCSSIEVKNTVHEFVAGDRRHPKSKEIYMMLEEMNGWLKGNGYTPQTDVVLHDIGETEKERSLEVHSQKLAISFGLSST